jgi:uncharacterized protein YciI
MADEKRFVVVARDGANSEADRARLYDAHRARLSVLDNVTIDAAGPLFAADALPESPRGSLFIITAPDVDVVWDFVKADPFYFGHVWESVDVHQFIPRRWRTS